MTAPALDCLCADCEPQHRREAAQRPQEAPAALPRPRHPVHPPVLRQRRRERLVVPCDCRRCETDPCPCQLCTSNRQAAAAALARRPAGAR